MISMELKEIKNGISPMFLSKKDINEMIVIRCKACGQNFSVCTDEEKERFLNEDREHCPVCAGTVKRDNDYVYHENIHGEVALLPIENFKKSAY